MDTARAQMVRVNRNGTLSVPAHLLREEEKFFVWAGIHQPNESDEFCWRLYISSEEKGVPANAKLYQVYFSNPRATTGYLSIKGILGDVARVNSILVSKETLLSDYVGLYDVVRVSKSKYYISLRRNTNGKGFEGKQGTEADRQVTVAS